ncbi:MAG TPA: hypothetical protein VG844_04745 [Terracidiphilus sp.]|nr:hypothetical protein [Terracidiphilus sp.]
MAGYSGTPLLQKLGIKEGHRVALRNAPDALPQELKDITQSRSKKDLDIVLLFAPTYAAFSSGFAATAQSVHADGVIWVAWLKKSSGIKTDLTEDMIRNFALKTPFVDVKVCAIDETWSGLKLVVRKELRAGFTKGMK